VEAAEGEQADGVEGLDAERDAGAAEAAIAA
jgi:hypothetical protein